MRADGEEDGIYLDVAKSTPKCPICSKPTAREFRPFCSRRCADVDLARWLKGAYAIPVTDSDADEDGDDVGADTTGGDAHHHGNR